MYQASGGVGTGSELNASEMGQMLLPCLQRTSVSGWHRPLTESIRVFKEDAGKLASNFRYILPHDSYLINLGRAGRRRVTEKPCRFFWMRCSAANNSG